MDDHVFSQHNLSEEPHDTVSKRLPAPRRLALVQSFLNSVDYEEGIEHFGSAGKVQDWFAAHSLIGETTEIASDDRARVIEFREVLRDIVGVNSGEELWEGATERFAEALGSAALLIPVAHADGRIDLSPAGDDLDAAFAELMLICQRASVDGTWQRFKLCRSSDCRWAFYDTSKNRSGVWCDMATCGSRHKARAYRRRKDPN
ncbi:MAG: CGNR zinc finger domain-containing protein [Thermomicrobiales bacterium]